MTDPESGNTQAAVEPADQLDAKIETLVDGPLLDEEDETKVVAKIRRLREAQDKPMQRRGAVWDRNGLWRDGERWVRLEKDEDAGAWQALLPLGASSAAKTPNKTDRLVRRVISTILQDEPIPECEPSSDEQDDRDAAEFATRALKAETAEAQLNFRSMMEEGMDVSSTTASSFSYFTIDPQGGGHKPQKIEAHPKAETAETATIDPTTGAAAPPNSYVERYVKDDGTLTDDASEAALQWQAKVKCTVLSGKHVRFLPARTKDISSAKGVIVSEAVELGELKANPIFAKKLSALSPGELNALVTDDRPSDWKELLPEHMRDSPPSELENDGGPSDDAVVIVHSLYYKSHGAYPRGAYIVIVGKVLLHRQKWAATVTQGQGENATEAEECIELPLSQCRQLNAFSKGDPYGGTITERLGIADEYRASLFGYALEHFFRFANPNVFLPVGSIVQPKQLTNRDGEPIYFNPQGKPEYETVPEFPREGETLRVEMSGEMDDESGLQQAAQGVEDASVQSGIHAQTIVEQALVALSQVRANAGDYYKRSCRVTLQLMRCFYTAEQMIKYVGEDGRHKQEAFTGADLGSTRDVGIARGSFTMQTQSAKRQMANDYFTAGLVAPEEYEQIVSASISPILGMQDNPYLQRIRRQINDWLDGPTQEFAAAVQARKRAIALQRQAMIVAQAQGAEIPAELQQQPAPLPTPFERVPPDLEILIAKVRHTQLNRVIASGKFTKFANQPEWQQLIVDEYHAMKEAANILTVEDQKAIAQGQAESQQQQLEAQAQAEQGAQQQELGLKQQELEQKRVDGEAERASKVQLADRDREHRTKFESDNANAERQFRAQEGDKERQLKRELADRDYEQRAKESTAQTAEVQRQSGESSKAVTSAMSQLASVVKEGTQQQLKVLEQLAKTIAGALENREPQQQPSITVEAPQVTVDTPEITLNLTVEPPKHGTKTIKLVKDANGDTTGGEITESE